MFLILSHGLSLKQNQGTFLKIYIFDMVAQHSFKNKSQFERVNKIGLWWEDWGRVDFFFFFLSIDFDQW